MKMLAFPAGAMIVFSAFFGLAAAVAGQESAAQLPRVIEAQAAFYHPFAHTVNMHGTVLVRIFTDGERVTEAEIEDDGGIPVLARAARDNALTWRFAEHEPIDFVVTYRYIVAQWLEDSNGVRTATKVVFRFPTNVDVTVIRWPQEFYTAPEPDRPRQRRRRP